MKFNIKKLRGMIMSKKLNDCEIKSILAEFAECGVVEHNLASVDFIKSVLELIERLQRENEMLELLNAVYREHCDKYNAICKMYAAAFKKQKKRKSNSIIVTKIKKHKFGGIKNGKCSL